MSEFPLEQAAQIVNDAFLKWGLPRRIKIDNGRPTVHPGNADLPTLLVLWWIGLGIEVVRNDPGCPQQNGTVEGLQGTCERWVNPKLHESVESLQEGLDEVGRIQRAVYRIARKGHKTRLDLYPELAHNPRRFNPQHFDMNRVHDYLADQVWLRHVKKKGVTKLFGKEIYVGKDFAHWPITITFDPVELQWMVRATDGTLLKTSKKQLITEQMIRKQVNMSKN